MARARHEQTPERAQTPRQDQRTAPAAAARRSTQTPSAPAAERRCGATAPRSPSTRVLQPAAGQERLPQAALPRIFPNPLPADS